MGTKASKRTKKMTHIVSVDGVDIAKCTQHETADGNIYFPPESLDMQYFKESSLHTTCGWKGKASYYDIVVGDVVLKDAAWYYPNPTTPAAKPLKDHVAFYRNKVDIREA